MDIAWLDVRANLEKIEDYIDDAEDQGAKILVFPEMALTGFCMDPHAAALELGSAELKRLAAMTRGKQVMVFIGAAIKQGSRYTNECLIIRNGEVVASYAKMNLFTVTDEHKYYEPGDQMITVSYEGYQITPLICFDTRFTKPFVKGAEAGTDAFIVMASWPDTQSAQWKTLLSARAMDTQAFVIGVNRIGSGGGLSFAGECMVVAPSGKAMLEYSSDEKLIFLDVDFGYSKKLKDKFPVLAEQHLNAKQLHTPRQIVMRSGNS
ncbi:MAG: hypothetical protein A2070_03575 [Bdellovibrionales bacterium GWC1_52_8]|nr:MAG: hypothetical protein A2Z97_05260 [Bdellovibrionales bacterium GWB1_52_6]OFZ04597.1 MAG: hypothetical protein A2X97_13335 [Bdellovibrionales bacterium GWA1_52_35]OFZ32808.1 MAG: hypothetical protein A2070_03575 [Bdellovibrionales bacterium GWC1_52_8]